MQRGKELALILGIDTSCDETAAAVVKDGKTILSNVVASQVKTHGEYGGVVPELACRMHLESIVGVIRDALSSAGCSLGKIDAVAVTQGPGLVGALLVGIGAAKAICYARGLPLLAINHLEGHIASALIGTDRPSQYPIVSLVVSGGHTSLFLVEKPGTYQIAGRTLDDAAGEAFDKVAKALGLGYPGGPIIERLATQAKGDPIDFPRPMINQENFNFSFSGLKTAVLNYLRFEKGISGPKEVASKLGKEMIARIASGFQHAVFDVLIEKSIRLARLHGASAITVGGGVAANNLLRREFSQAASRAGLTAVFPPKPLCTDNAAMIAAAAYHHFQNQRFSPLTLDAEPRLSL